MSAFYPIFRRRIAPLCRKRAYFTLPGTHKKPAILFGHSVFDQIYQTVKGCRLIGSVCKQRNGGSADDTHREHAEKALRVNAAFPRVPISLLSLTDRMRTMRLTLSPLLWTASSVKSKRSSYSHRWRLISFALVGEVAAFAFYWDN